MKIHYYGPEAPRLSDEEGVNDLIGQCYGADADLVVIPVDRLADEFFTLSSGLAGLLAQKFAQYRLRVAVVGDIGEKLAASNALRAYVGETNRGRDLWFVADQAELDERLRTVSR